mmetsp:Transcript_8910/g.7902  ORF Transcript_8910/g.7902 Transcript_8910/m.7902 type:complete len:99 (+) Transcript_8910:469-765(+)
MEKRKSVLMSENSFDDNSETIPKELFQRSLSLQEEEETYDLEGVEDPFGKEWKLVENEMKMKGLYSTFATYRLRNFIFKSNDDLRQELLAIQLIKRLK